MRRRGSHHCYPHPLLTKRHQLTLTSKGLPSRSQREKERSNLHVPRQRQTW
jgi:hypothetical protein